jgi:flagellar hook protein FlgE
MCDTWREDMFDVVNQALSAVRANAVALSANANNVANVNTPDFRPAESSFESNPHGGVTVSLSTGPAPPEGVSGTDLASETVDLVTYKNGLKAGASMVRQGDKMLGTLIDMMK